MTDHRPHNHAPQNHTANITEKHSACPPDRPVLDDIIRHHGIPAHVFAAGR